MQCTSIFTVELGQDIESHEFKQLVEVVVSWRLAIFLPAVSKYTDNGKGVGRLHQSTCKSRFVQCRKIFKNFSSCKQNCQPYFHVTPYFVYKYRPLEVNISYKTVWLICPVKYFYPERIWIRILGKKSSHPAIDLAKVFRIRICHIINLQRRRFSNETPDRKQNS